MRPSTIIPSPLPFSGRIYAALVLIFLTVAARADILVLDDGSRVEGKVHKDGDQWIVIDNSGHETDVPTDSVVSIQIGSGQEGGNATERLATLRSSAEALSDLSIIIQRFQTFISQNPGTPEAGEAQSDLAIWQQRQDQQCIKVGRQWLTPTQREAMIASEANAAVRITGLVQQHQMQDAADLLKQALDVDPADPAALYLNGLVLADAGQTALARMQFEAAIKAVPGHAPTLNNMGALRFRQNLIPAALAAYTQAMQSKPFDRIILDNVAEALHAVQNNEHDSPPVIAAAKMFVEQDEHLQKSQEANGLFRWGATWVSKQQLQALNAEEQAIQNKLDLIQNEYDATQRDITAYDATISQDQQDITRLAAAQYVPQQTVFGGQTFNQPPGVNQPPGMSNTAGLPQAYFDDQAEINRATAAKQSSTRHLAELREQARKVEMDLSVPMYTGVSRLIGAEGTPIRTGFWIAGGAAIARLENASRPRRRRHGQNMKTALIISTPVILLLGFLLISFAKLEREREIRANRDVSSCRKNLITISTALHAFARDHNGHFPDKLSRLVLDGYEKDGVMFFCPSGSDYLQNVASYAPQEIAKDMDRPGHLSYLYFGSSLTEASPKDSILLADRPDNHTELGFAGGHVVYLGGDIVFLRPAELKAALAMPQHQAPSTQMAP